MTLKDKIIKTGIIKLDGNEVKRFSEQDVKEAVLEFQEIIKYDSQLLILYKTIFGDFKE